MKKVRKFEQCVVTVLCALVLWATMFIGAFYWCEDTFNMKYDESFFVTCVYGIVTGYWLIRKIVFKFIEIIKR